MLGRLGVVIVAVVVVSVCFAEVIIYVESEKVHIILRMSSSSASLDRTCTH